MALRALDAEIAALEDKKSQADALRVRIRARYADQNAEQSFAIDAAGCTCTIGPAPNVRAIVSMQAVFESVGAFRFIEACSFPLKKLDEYVDAAIVEQLVTRARTGPRPVKTFAKAK